MKSNRRWETKCQARAAHLASLFFPMIPDAQGGRAAGASLELRILLPCLFLGIPGQQAVLSHDPYELCEPSEPCEPPPSAQAGPSIQRPP